MPKRVRDLTKTRQYVSAWKTAHLDKSILNQARSSARRKGLEFNLTVEDTQVPAVCPILGIPLFRTEGRRTHNTPSLDRIDNSKGYVKGNVAIISWRANQLKNNATLVEIQALLRYMESL